MGERTITINNFKRRGEKGQFIKSGLTDKQKRERNNAAQRRYWKKNKEFLNRKQVEYNAKQKKIVYDFYGRKCNCCGESRMTMLSIDHVNNDGYKDRNNSGRGGNSTKLYTKIIREGFSNDYQILCMNCNVSKKLNGGICEHITEMYE